MVDIFDVFYLVKAEIERSEICEALQSSDVGDEVVIEIKVVECLCERGKAFDFGNDILAQAEAL